MRGHPTTPQPPARGVSGRPRRRFGERLFALLLGLFPAGFRREFGAEMAEVFRREQALHRRARGRLGLLGFWCRTLAGLLRTAAREQWDDLGLDLRYSLRTMARRPLFVATAVLSLSVGIGATTAVVAVFEAAFLRGVPGVGDARRLVNVKPISSHEESFELTSYPTYVDLRDGNATLAELAGFSGLQASLSLGAGDEPEVIATQVVTPSYFSVLGVTPERGRFFLAEEERTPEPVAVVSARLWRDRLGGAALGQAIWVNGRRFTVVGVAPEGFRGHFIGFNFDLFLPTAMGSVTGLSSLEERDAKWVEMVGRLAGESTLASAQADLALLGQQLAAAYPDLYRDVEIEVEGNTGIDADLRGGLLGFLVIMLGVCGFVLLIACVNVANMMLSRTVWRRQEMAVRRALGASAGRLARQLLTESLVLSLLAGGLGALLATWAIRLAGAAFGNIDSRIALDLRLDGLALLAALGVSLATALAFGLAPGLEAARTAPAGALRRPSEVGRGSRLRAGLIVAQVVLSLVVLICASLFLRALQHATRLDPGFDARGVHGTFLDPGLTGMDGESSQALLAEILERVEVLAEVEAAALVNRIPLSLGARFFPNPIAVEVPGLEPPPDQEGFLIEHALVSEGYFDTLRIPVLAGRGFTTSDRDGSGRVALANEAFARRFFDGGTVVGRTLRHGEQALEIVGLVRDSKYRQLDEEPTPFLYLPLRQSALERAMLVARAASPAADLAAALRATIRELAPHLPLPSAGRLEERLGVSVLPQRIAAAVAGLLGLLGLFLTAVGLYGVLAYSVSRRSREIGLRISLGATPGSVLGLVVRRGLLLVLLGIGIGIPAAAIASRFLGAFLFGLSPNDAPTYGAVAAGLLLTALFASYLPARRAARIDPQSALRAE